MLPKFKSILCLNGKLPEYKWFEYYKKLTIIAADGAVNLLAKINIAPNFIIGDLDSISKQALHLSHKKLVQNENSNLCKIIKVLNQEKTDFEKCLIEMDNLNLFPALIFGISGGEIDHMIYNLNCFMQASLKYRIVFLDYNDKSQYQWGVPIIDEIAFSTNHGNNISLLPYPNACVSSKGLQWELCKTYLSTNGLSSIRNKVTSNNVRINVHKGKILMILNNINRYIDPA